MAHVSSNASDVTDLLTGIKVAPSVRCFSIPVLLFKSYCLSFCYTLPTTTTFSFASNYTAPPVFYMASVLPIVRTESPDAFYSSLVNLAHFLCPVYQQSPTLLVAPETAWWESATGRKEGIRRWPSWSKTPDSWSSPPVSTDCPPAEYSDGLMGTKQQHQSSYQHGIYAACN